MDKKTRLAIGVLSVLLIPFFAVEPGQSAASGRSTGDQAMPILVHDVYELQNMSLDLNGSYALANDIDAVITRTWNGGLGFAPIGNPSQSFNGSFDGRGHSISGLFINRSMSYHVGLFSTAGYSIFGPVTISDVRLVSVEITGQDSVGGLVGWTAGNISGCSVSGWVTGHDAVGGLVGGSSYLIVNDQRYILGQWPCSIMNCRSGGFVKGHGSTGGIVGLNYGSIINCSSSARLVSGDTIQAGGIAGENSNATIKDCQSTGMVIGDLYVGGLVGANSGNIFNSVSSGPVWGRYSVGGFVGWNGAESRYDSETISRCHSTGNVYLLPQSGNGPAVPGAHWDIGGFVGLNLGRISRSFCTGIVTGDTKSGGFAGQNMDWDYNFPQEASISECYCQCTVNGTDTVGGFVGNNTGTLHDVYCAGTVEPGFKNGGFASLNTGSVVSCFWDNETAGIATTAGGTGENTSNMMKRATFEGWDFDNLWEIVENETYPTFNRSTMPDFGHAPMITTVPEPVATENQTYEIDYYAYDADPKADLRWELSTDAGWLTMDNDSGLLSGRPSASDIGKYTVTVNVSDGQASDGQRFILTVLRSGASLANRPPVILSLTSPSETRIAPSTQLSFRVVARDPDGDELRFTWTENGTVLGTGPDFTIVFSEGEHSLVLSVSDGGHNTTQEFHFTVAPPRQPVGGRSVSYEMYGWVGASTTIAVALGLSAYAGIEPGKYRLTLLLVLPLYTRIHEEEALDNETRGLIRGCILAEPGIHFNELLRRLGLSNGLAAYHLQTLERVGMIRSRNDGIFKRFYPAGMRVADIPVRLNKMQKVIFEVLREKEGLSERDVADALEVSYYSVHRHINRMAKMGVLRLEHRGMTVKCYIANGRKQTDEGIPPEGGNPG